MFTLIDATGLLLAAGLFAPLLILPGYLIGTSLNPLDFRAAKGRERLMLAVLLTHAILPAPLAFVTTLVGLKTGMALLIALTICGAVALGMDGLPRLTRRDAALGAIWFAGLAFAWIDVEWGGRLYQSLTTIDMLKHASITRAIVDAGGTPPADPFFARPGKAVFYYFYFVMPAFVEVLAGGLIDSRAAVGGMVFWTGLALFGLMVHVYRASGLRAGATIAPLLIVLALASGLQILTALLLGLAQSNSANTQITPWLLSLVWVPHHVAGFIASWIALLLLAEVSRHDGRAGKIFGCLLAGAALATAAGQSIWVTFGTVASVGLWALYLASQRRWGAIAAIVAAGVVSLLIAAPFLASLVGTSATGQSPIAFQIRPFVYAEGLASGLHLPLLEHALNLLLLPFNYMHEMGIMLAGALAYWLRAAYRRAPPNDVALLLAITALAALIIGTFFKSAIANNDLGWRVMMFVQLSALLWTAHVVWPFWLRARQGLRVVGLARRLPRVMGLFLVLGLATVAYDMLLLRFAYATPFKTPGSELRAPLVDLELRRAFVWLTANVGRDRVIQHNPNSTRTFAFALYGRQPVAISDMHNPFLLGAAHDAVEQRLEDIAPLFTQAMPRATFVERLRKHGVDLLVISSIDPIWTMRPAWLEAAPTIFASQHVRVIPVDQISP